MGGWAGAAVNDRSAGRIVREGGRQEPAGEREIKEREGERKRDKEGEGKGGCDQGRQISKSEALNMSPMDL